MALSKEERKEARRLEMDKTDEIIQWMRSKPKDFEQRFKEAITKIADINTFQDWRDAEFTLLFHASVENCPEAVDWLLEAGADPTVTNYRGTCVLHLMAKRGQLTCAENCFAKVPEDMRFCFINGPTTIGKRKGGGKKKVLARYYVILFFF
jgi:hypothetical protein